MPLPTCTLALAISVFPCFVFFLPGRFPYLAFQIEVGLVQCRHLRFQSALVCAPRAEAFHHASYAPVSV